MAKNKEAMRTLLNLLLTIFNGQKLRDNYLVNDKLIARHIQWQKRDAMGTLINLLLTIFNGKKLKGNYAIMDKFIACHLQRPKKGAMQTWIKLSFVISNDKKPRGSANNDKFIALQIQWKKNNEHVDKFIAHYL